MSDLTKVFDSNYTTNISSYSGVFDPDLAYQKFDYVFNTGDGLYYYAREDMAFGGGVDLTYSNRFTFDPSAPMLDGVETYYIYDNLNAPDEDEFFEGQEIYISGSTKEADGRYRIISIEKDIDIALVLDDQFNISTVLDDGGVVALNGWYQSSWFFKSNISEPNEINKPNFYKDSENLIYHEFWGWIHVFIPHSAERAFWFYSQAAGGIWLWASNTYLGSENTSSNSFLYIEDSENSLIGPGGWTEWFGLSDYVIDEDYVYHPFRFFGEVYFATNELRSKYGNVKSQWNNSTLEISREEYDMLPDRTRWHKFTGLSGYRYSWLLLGKNAFKRNPQKAIAKNHTNNSFYAMTLDDSFELIENSDIVGKIAPVVGPTERVGGIEKARFRVKGIGANDIIRQYEPYSNNEITISKLKQDINENPDSWSRDLFFFDADYGSTVNYAANNYRYEYGNGYFRIQPKSINSLDFEVDLQFKNRTNREANAIVHFLENHQGQHEKDSSSPYLKYSLGMSGFRWDGNATFHPYDSTEMQSKKFYASSWEHSLNFENTNDLSVKIKNLDTSLLQKISGMYVNPARQYSDSEFYEKNDVVFDYVSKNHYYWYSETSAAGKRPSQSQTSWSREKGYNEDINTEYWTRDFLWKPSIGLNISQSPRVSDMTFGNGYHQIHRDGINESLLKFDLEFNNRSDEEAYAILHFLEQHCGYIPFVYALPAPYETRQNFICESWSHSYNYKNNHSIKAKFEQFPFNMSAQQISNDTTPSLGKDAELTFTSPLIMKEEGDGEDLNQNSILRSRVILQNIGTEALNLYNASITPESLGEFSIIGQGSRFPAVKTLGLLKHQYNVTLPPSRFGSLNNAKIALAKSYTEGTSGGIYFDQLNDAGLVIDTFFQSNQGWIKSIRTASFVDNDPDAFVTESFIQNNSINSLAPGEQAYIEVLFKGIPDTSNSVKRLTDQYGNKIVTDQSEYIEISRNSGYYLAYLTISTSNQFSPQVGQVMIYIDII